MFAYTACRTTKARNARGEGISVYEIAKDGSWNRQQVLKTEDNPSFFCLDHTEQFLYSVHGDGTSISAYAIKAGGTLEALNRLGRWKH